MIDEIDKADIEFPNDLLQELDRMEFYVYETGKLVKASSVSMAERRQQISIIRYADDFVIIHPSLQVIQLTKHFVNTHFGNGFEPVYKIL